MRVIATEVISLTGEKKHYTEDSGHAYLVKEGAVLVYIVPLIGSEPSRRQFLYEAQAGERIPALCWSETQDEQWLFLFVALDRAVLECEPGQNSKELMVDFARRAHVKMLFEDEVEEQFVEFYRLCIVKEELYIYMTAEEQRGIYERGLELIANVFMHKATARMAHSGNRLYDAVSFLCSVKRMEMIPFDSLTDSYGHRFSVEDIARLSHFACRDVMLNDKWYQHDNGALIVFDMQTKKPLICIPRSSSSYLLYDLEIGTKQRVTPKVAAQLQPQAKMLYRPLPQKALKLTDLIAYCAGELTSYDIGWFLLMSLFGTLVGLLLPYINEQLYDKFIPMGDHIGLVQLCLLGVSCVMGWFGFKIVENLALFRSSAVSRYALQGAMFDRLFGLPQHVIDQYDSADLSMRAYGASQMVSVVFDVVITSLVSASFSLLYLFRMFKYSKKLSWIALLVIVLSLAVLLGIGMRQMKYEKQVLDASSKANSLMYQLLGGIAKIRIAGVENRALYEYLKIHSESERLTKRKETLTVLVNAMVVALPTIFTIIFYFIILRKHLDISIGALMGFNTAFSAFSGAMLKLTQSFLQANDIVPVYDRAKPVLETLPEFEEGAILPGKLLGEIEVSNLVFNYPNVEKTVIDHISIKIEAGEYIGIVGSSGCGKSTLLKLLLGFAKPKSGKIYYDGKDLDSMDKRELRKRLGVVLQNGQLIAGSILENVTIANPNARLSQVEKIIKLVGLYEDIKKMPMGLHTVLSEDSGTISGGQKQRLLIARAIVGNPAVLFFDEATSALDNLTQKTVCDSLEKMGVTRIVIAHRLSTIINCDRILVMDQGHIVEQGSYAELMEKQGIFFHLAARQMV